MDTDNKKKDILILGKESTDELDDTKITAEDKYFEEIFGRIRVTNKMEDVNLKAFHIFKGIKESKTLANHI